MASDIFEVKYLGRSGGGNQWQVVTHWLSTALVPGTNPYTDAVQVCTAFDTAMQAQFKNCIPDDTVIDYCTARRVNNSGGNTAIKVINVAGTFGGVGTTIAIGGQLRFITIDARHQGKMFLPGICAGMIEDDTLQLAYIANMQSLNGVLQGGFNLGIVPMLQVIYSRGGVVRDIVAWDVAGKPGAQRKRMVPLF